MKGYRLISTKLIGMTIVQEWENIKNPEVYRMKAKKEYISKITQIKDYIKW